MRELRLSGLILLLGLSVSAQAEIMSPVLPSSSIGLGLSTLHVEQPDSSTEQRYRWDVHEYMHLPWNLRLHNRLGIARDTRPRADSIQVHHHFYELASALQWTGTKLFRYGVGAGPLLLVEQTMTRIQLDETRARSNNRVQLGATVEAELDYAFNANWELALVAAWQFRPAVEKQDFAFGVSLQFNKGHFSKEESPKPRTPPPGKVSN